MTTPPAVAGRRHFLMCPPTYFRVGYQINPWMDTSRPVDAEAAMAQWRYLVDALRDMGHQIDVVDPLPGYPDMVYAANGATVVDGIAYEAVFRYSQRGAEGPAYLKWFADHGYATVSTTAVNEGEGDLILVGDALLAGTGFRTDRAAHHEAAQLWNRQVITLELVDPRFYHLDTALTVLQGFSGKGPADIAYYPEAFSPASQEILRERYPDALIARAQDAEVLGLNAISDGEHVVVTPAATGYAGALRERGYVPVPIDTSELLLGGGGAKCCVLSIRERAPQ